MYYATVIVRILLGLTFAVLGMNYFFNFIAMPTPNLSAEATSFMQALGPSGYMSAVKVFEISGGVLLLTGILVPFGIVLLTPVIVNIFFYDIFLMRAPGLGIPLLAMALFLIWAYRSYFAAVFTIHAEPAGFTPRRIADTSYRK